MVILRRILFQLIVVVLLLTFTVSSGLAVTIDSHNWSRQLGGTFGDTTRTVTTNSDGDVIVVGEYASDNFDPDGDSGSESFSTPGSRSGFITLFSADGTYQWTKVLIGGASSAVDVKEVVADSANNIYVTGGFTNTVDFDPGAGTQNRTAPSGPSDIFILKLSASGEFEWVQTAGSTSSDAAYSLSLSSDKVFIGGVFRGTVDFDPGVGTDSKASTGDSDAFIWALDHNGDHQFVQTYGSTGSETVYHLEHNNGNVYVTGMFANTVDFDPGAGTVSKASEGSQDIYLSVFTEEGEFSQVLTWGDTEFDGPDYVVVSEDGSVYVSGYFDGSVDFDPSGGTNIKTTVGNDDFFISKFDSSMNYQWTSTFGSADYDYIYGLDTDSENNVYATGEFWEAIDLNPGSGTNEVTASGDNDIFILQLNADGTFGEALTLGSTGTDYGNGLVVDDTKLYVGGAFSSTVSFNGADSDAEFTSNGSTDAFLTALELNNFSVDEPTTDNSSPSNQSNSISSKPKSCEFSTPTGNIDLFQITRSGSTAQLFFTPITDSVTSYHVVFGLQEGDERFGGLSIAASKENNRGVQSITIHSMDANQEYWFRVIPVNGCAVGNWSNWQVAGASPLKETIFYRY